jgi:hypothetical protein
VPVVRRAVVHCVTERLPATHGAGIKFGAFAYHYAASLAFVGAVPLQRPQPLRRVGGILGGCRVRVALHL